MGLARIKVSLILVLSILFMLCLLFNFDNDSLNSFVMDYKDNFIIREVNVGDDNSDNENNVLEEKSNVTFINAGNDNRWTFPVDGNYVITTYYGYDHRAIDIYDYAGYGASVLSANSGVVVSSSSSCYRGDLFCNGNRGNYVIVKHNVSDYYTIYMHLASINVSLGDIVSSGQVIGTMGNTGYVIPTPSDINPYGGTHLHFCVFVGEPYNGGYAINPFDLY